MMRRLSWMPSRRFLLIFIPIHAAIGVLMFLWAFGAGMARFDSGDPQGKAEAFAEIASVVLLNPLFMGVAETSAGVRWFPGLLGYIPILVNSLLWAVCIWVLAAAGSRLVGSDVVSSAPN